MRDFSTFSSPRRSNAINVPGSQLLPDAESAEDPVENIVSVNGTENLADLFEGVTQLECDQFIAVAFVDGGQCAIECGNGCDRLSWQRAAVVPTSSSFPSVGSHIRSNTDCRSSSSPAPVLRADRMPIFRPAESIRSHFVTMRITVDRSR